ncbi:uncharacterized protein LOC111898909 [Lactuca sativa]|uniref:uncharacterized protein LOC111898909 n=1 Tax=Lactuca sativa TaxID=4236 RepID=UPI000CD96FDE|nr:uncharacterized protein LOC111898909 [Lactuca sativa]
MKDGKCKKHFPKLLLESTFFDSDGYVRYNRSSAAKHTTTRGIPIDNGYIVPYNRRLCSRFDAHINVEYCGWNMMIRYLFKYISKGADRVRYALQKTKTDDTASPSVVTNNNNVDAKRKESSFINEIQNFLDGRYICSHEAAWRILDFHMSIYETIIGYIENKKQIFMFYYGHGGTGKTFLWTTILSYFRSIGKVVLAVATSGIVSLLLPSGTTAYSRFKIPIDLTNKKSCDIKKRTMLGDLMCHTSLIVWDEAPMSDRRCFEFLDRQTLPVVPKSTRSEIIALTLPNSYLWALFEVMMLTENMCLLSNTDAETHTISIIDFARWILNIGDGLLGCPNTDDPDNTSWVQIPESLLIPSEPSALKDLIQFVYGDCILTHPIAIDVSQREIVCPTNEVADKINNIVLKAITNSGVVYNTTDSM